VLTSPVALELLVTDVDTPPPAWLFPPAALELLDLLDLLEVPASSAESAAA